MTINRTRTVRSRNRRRIWLTGTVAVGVVAATGGVATASFREPADAGDAAEASKTFTRVSSEEHEDSESREESSSPTKTSSHRKGSHRICIRLDEDAQEAIAQAEVAEDGSVTIPITKAAVRRCPRPDEPAPTDAPTAEPTSSPAPTAAPTKPPTTSTTTTKAPTATKTTTTKPPTTTTTKAPTPTPTVTSTAS